MPEVAGSLTDARAWECIREEAEGAGGEFAGSEGGVRAAGLRTGGPADQEGIIYCRHNILSIT